MASTKVTRRRVARSPGAAGMGVTPVGGRRMDDGRVGGARAAAARSRPTSSLARDAAPATHAAARLPGLDALRGLALLAMIAYHFGFDLRWFGLARFDLEHDVAWIAARSAILGSFLLIAGASLVLAARRPAFLHRYLLHLARIVGAALLVSLASYLAFPATWIRFGVLHAIAVSLVLALPLVERPRAALVLGVLVVVAGIVASHRAFDATQLAWIGFMTHRPATEDYVPLFPWTGLLFVGVALGHALLRAPHVLAPLARLPRALRWLGRHSLATYLVHQPTLVALLWLATRR